LHTPALDSLATNCILALLASALTTTTYYTLLHWIWESGPKSSLVGSWLGPTLPFIKNRLSRMDESPPVTNHILALLLFLPSPQLLIGQFYKLLHWIWDCLLLHMPALNSLVTNCILTCIACFCPHQLHITGLHLGIRAKIEPCWQLAYGKSSSCTSFLPVLLLSAM
jgi:hypothetical protein